MPNSVTTIVTYSERQRAKWRQQQQQQFLFSNTLKESRLCTKVTTVESAQSDSVDTESPLPKHNLGMRQST